MNNYFLETLKLNAYGHNYLKELFHFPDYYGYNLDALYDCLSELEPSLIIIKDYNQANEYSSLIYNVLFDVIDEYQNILIEYY